MSLKYCTRSTCIIINSRSDTFFSLFVFYSCILHTLLVGSSESFIGEILSLGLSLSFALLSYNEPEMMFSIVE